MTPEGDLTNVRFVTERRPLASKTPDGELIVLDSGGWKDFSDAGVWEPGVSSPRVEIAEGLLAVTRSIAGVATCPGMTSPFLKRPAFTNPYSMALPMLAMPKRP